MLTVEESRWSLGAFKIFSALNVFPIGVDVKSGKIKRTSNGVKVFIWKFFFGAGVLDWLYMFGRLVQSTILEGEKYFRWDHFVLHFGLTVGYAVCYFTGLCLFLKNPVENIVIFNQLFVNREDSVQKMMHQQLEINPKSGNGNGKRVCTISAPGNKTRAKTGTRLVSTPAQEQHEQIEMKVIENGSESESNLVGPRPLLTWPPQYSLDELVAKVHPFAMVFTVFFTILFLATDPSRPQLLYSSLPPEWQNAWSFCILLAVEVLCTAISLFTASFAIVTQVLFFGKVQLEFKRMRIQLRNLEEKFQNGNPSRAQHVEKEVWILRQILKEIRELVLLIELFNRCFPFPIFAWKICCLAIPIVWYFFAIRHSEDFPVLGLFSGYVAITLTLIYSIMYARAFSIPGKMDELKQEFLLTAQKTSNSNGSKNPVLWAEMNQEIKRIHGVGIKVGSFHQMERESTPNFIDFVLRNVVTLLVTFPR